MNQDHAPRMKAEVSANVSKDSNCGGQESWDFGKEEPKSRRPRLVPVGCLGPVELGFALTLLAFPLLSSIWQTLPSQMLPYPATVCQGVMGLGEELATQRLGIAHPPSLPRTSWAGA